MKPILSRIFVVLLLLVAPARSEVILQYFGTSWAEIERRLPELAERGYDSLWLPPPFKAGAGTYSVGFDTFDRFDLGDRDQSGTVRTKYGTKADLISMMKAAHRFGIRVYFDNVMAHNAGPLDSNTTPGNLFPGIPGFVPEDFHIVRDGTTWRKPADYPNYQDEWQVLNRNPFAWDIAQETPNVSFNPTGTGEAHTYAKWSGIRHPGKTQWYLDTDLTVATNQAGDDVHPFADKEPYQDVGYVDGGNTIGANNGKFDFKDTVIANGQHDPTELSEPFDDTGVDPTIPSHVINTTVWGAGDGRYNMGNPVAEDVNSMLYRSVRWFIDEAKPDGFRLDAVKHVPFYFFGKTYGDDKSSVNWGYNGQIQEQFNISRGFSDWDNHRNSIFSSEYDARDDAMLFGEHLGSPPAEGGYLDAGMRIANDNLLNTVKGGIGSSLAGYDQRNYGGWGNQEGSQAVNYVMSHDNNYLYGDDRPAAHAYILTREGLPIIYTDGFNQAGAPDYFPKPAYVNFLGQKDDDSITGALNVHRDFARGYQRARWSDQNFVAYERIDDREKKGGSWNGETMLFMMARNYQGNGQARNVVTGFPVGATLENQSPHGGKFRVYVQNDSTINDGSGNKPIVPEGGWFAFTWHNPGMPKVWQAADHKAQIPPIQIYQNGTLAPMMDHWRVDGKDGDAVFNPYGMPAGDTATRSYRVKIPRVTDGTSLRFVARADGSAENIRMKLDGGVDINSQIPRGPTTGDLRDFAPGLNTDQVNPGDTVLQASTSTYLGYEQMAFVRRHAEKFAAVDRTRNVIASQGAETYQVVVGTIGATINNGGGITNTGDTVVSWTEHDPAATNQHNSNPVQQLNPPAQSAAGQPIDLWVKIGYSGQPSNVWIYYTTDGATYPEGSHGVGKGVTQVVSASWSFNGANDGTALPDWYKATLPAMPNGTVLRYKIGVKRSGNASSIFPFSNANIDLAERMETLFEITNFNATAAPYRVHNDYSQMATGLTEGFHVLRSRAFVNRNDGSSIFKTNTQVFYYDAAAPTGIVAYPQENSQLGGSSYGAVVLTDPSVTEVWYYIEDINPGNDNPASGNGLFNWAQATPVATPTNLGSSGYAKEWRFIYQNIPASGNANIVVRLKEASSSTDMSLGDASGRFTTITRSVITGSDINFNIGIPTGPGQTVDDNYVMKVYFKKDLIQPPGMSDTEFLNEFSIFISSTISGHPDNPVFQPREDYRLVRDVNGTEHMVEFTFPNLYNGDANFLHTVRAEHHRGSLTHGDSELVRMRADDHLDTDGDGMPDWWERLNGMETTNGTGRHGAQGDFDNDGTTNIREYLFGLNPVQDDASAVPQVTIVKHPTEASTWQLEFPTIPNRLYQWQSSTNLIDWQNIGNPHNTAGASSGGDLQRNDEQSGPTKLFRMSVLPSP